MPNDPSERMANGLLEAFWLFGAAARLRPCDGCGDPIAIGDKCYLPAGFFTKSELSNVTARDIGIMETYCADCGLERRAFLTEAIRVLKSARPGEGQ